jgi:hypothetical protein
MQTSKGACRLCGDPTLDTEGIPYDGLKCVRESLCERDARQFETWTYQNRSRRYPRESPVTDDDLLTYIANIVQKLAKLQSQGFGIHRCAVRSPERHVTASAGELLSFSVDPQIEATFGKAPAGAFDSARGLVGYALDFVNGDAVNLADFDPRVMTDIDRLFRSGAGRQQWRDWLKRFLSQLLADRARAQRWVTKQLPDIWVLPRCARGASGGIELRFHVLLRTPAAFVRFVVLLLADESRGLGLCQCKLARCRKFFLKETPKGGRGAPKHVYCDEKHKDEARREDAKRRAKKSRARKAAKKHK